MRWFSRAAHPRRIFVEQAQARDRLARVEQDRAGPGDRLDIGRVSVAIPDRCWSVLSAERSAASIARALPSIRINTVPAATVAVGDAALDPHFASSARKKSAARSSPATTIGSRQFIVAAKRAEASIVARLVTSPPRPEILGQHALDEFRQLELRQVG
jgi:hypothetical protein